MTKQPKILCVIRIGNNQACSNWIFDNELLSHMTLVVSRFQPLTFSIPDHPSIVHHEYKGGKWEGIFHFLQENPETLNEYDYFFFPDDDIETSSANILSFFKVCFDSGLKLAQPALNPDSYFSHLITLQRSKFSVRCTDYVELMVPFMSREVLIQSLPFFENTVFGWGIDFIWDKFVFASNSEVGIVDATPVGHYRPLAGNNTQDAKAVIAQKKMQDELLEFMHEYEIKLSNFTVTTARTNDKKHISNRMMLRILNAISIHKLPQSALHKTKNIRRSYRLSKREISAESLTTINHEKIRIFINAFYRTNPKFSLVEVAKHYNTGAS